MLRKASVTKTTIVTAATGLFSVPQICVLITHASFLIMANESIAYRYFLVARLAAGEGGNAWLPQGQLTSLFQRGAFSLIPLIMPGGDVFDRMDLLGLIYGFSVVAAFAALLAVVAVVPKIRISDTLLIATTPVATAYLLANLHYLLQADYQHLNLVLFAAAVALFIYFKAVDDERRLVIRAAGFGVFIGLCAANKVSVVFIGAPVGAALIIDLVSRRDWRHLAIAVVTAAGTATAIVTFVFLALYNFKLNEAATAFSHVKSFALQPGNPEPWFLRQFLEFSIFTHYFHAAVAFAAATALVAWVRSRDHRDLVLIGVLVFTGLAYIAVVFHRPAGSTAYDMACAMVTLCAMTLSLLPDYIVTGPRLVGFIGLLALATWSNLQPKFVTSLAASRKNEDIRLDVWRYAKAAEAPIIAILPDDRWALNGGPLPALVKGLSDFPSWTIPPGRSVLASLSQPLSVRTGTPSAGLGIPYPDDATLVWEDIPDLPGVAQLDTALELAIAGRQCREWHQSGTLRVCLPLRRVGVGKEKL